MKEIFSKLFDIASPKVIFVSIFVYVVARIVLLSWSTAVIPFLLVFSIYGYFDVRYRNGEIILTKRCNLPQSFPVFRDFKIVDNSYSGYSLKKFEYEDFVFKIAVFENGMAKAISYPFCTKCDNFVVETVKQHFITGISIKFKCNTCGVSHNSKFTKSELMMAVAQHFGMTIDQDTRAV